jgi:hypothetical protein
MQLPKSSDWKTNARTISNAPSIVKINDAALPNFTEFNICVITDKGIVEGSWVFSSL